MTNSIYPSLARQSGLMKEMQIVANNIANVSTTGFRREGMLFGEHLMDLEANGDTYSIPRAIAGFTREDQGAFRQSGGQFDMAIEGSGFFLISTPNGDRLTRAGAFSPGSDGTIMTPDGHQLLDAGGAPVFAPTEFGLIEIAEDGTMSADGQPIGQIGLWEPVDPLQLRREEGTRFASEAGIQPVIGGKIIQGYVERSNVDPVLEIARMIEVQRAYEFGQSFLEQEDKRIGSVISTVGGS